MQPKYWILLASLLGASGVALGAFQAHGLEPFLARQGLTGEELAKRMNNCEVGVRYQMYHALALLAVAWVVSQTGGGAAQTAGFCLFAGVLIFSGCLYGIVFTGVKILGAIVPIGGLLMIIGWLSLAVAAWSWPQSGG